MNKGLLLDIMQSLSLSAYITKISDEHLNEFIHDSDKKVRFLTGFSGSQGTAVTSEDKSVLYTDPRYFLQAKQELNGYELMKEGCDDPISKFLEDNFNGKSIGLSLKQYPSRRYKDLKEKLEKGGITIVPVEPDLVDLIWLDKPEKKFESIVNLEKFKLKDFVDERWVKMEDFGEVIEDENITGSSYIDKIDRIKKLISDDEGLLISDLNTIAWVFNLRGSDIEHQSVFYSYAYITKDSTKLFVSVKLKLKGVEICKYEDFNKFLDQIEEKTVVISGDCNAYICNKLKKVRYTEEINRMKSIKTKVETAGFELAGTMDGVALIRLFGWLDSVIDVGVTEKQVANKLLEFKKKIKGFVGPSFSTIVGTGENGAILHHEAGGTTIDREDLILTDSGSHYYYGTTDISRTVHFGTPTDEMKRNFTLVLKGTINARMLNGARLRANDIDSAARKYLNDEGFDYKTATGHGVGYYLSVHERPPLISENDDVIEENQVFTIEPGLSQEGRYGIRTEDMVLSVNSLDEYSMANLSFVPLSLNLIDVDMLDDKELGYINDYSAAVYSHLNPYMEDDELALKYLEKNTQRLERPE